MNKLLKSFKNAYFADVPDKDRQTLQDNLGGQDQIECLLTLAVKRSAGQVLVKVDPISNPHGDFTAHRTTRILAVVDDRPFTVDSIAAELARHNLNISFITYPAFNATRDAVGMLQDIGGETREAYIIILVNGTLSEQQCRVLEQDLQSVLNDVLLVTRDWQTMRAKVRETISELQTAKIPENAETRKEYCDFLQYLHDNNFTLIGMRSYRFAADDEGNIVSSIIPDDNLGMLSDDRKPVFLNKSQQSLPQDLQRLRLSTDTVAIYKVNRKSSVHRRVPLDAIAVKQFDATGKVIGERMIVGLFTSVTYSRSVTDVPLLRRKVRQVIENAEFQGNSHDHRAIQHILEKYPRDELFQMEPDQILEYVLSILTLQQRQRVALYLRADPFRRYVSALVYVPRELYETHLRQKLQAILETQLHGNCTSFNTVLDDSPLARVTFVIETDPNQGNDYSATLIEEKLMDAARSYPEKLHISLLRHHTEERRATELAIQYQDAFPKDYQDRYKSDIAASDIDFIEQALHTQRLVSNLFRVEKMAPTSARLKLYHAENQLGLSDILPLLENMGVRVLAEYNFETYPTISGKSVWIQDFLLSLPKGAEIQSFAAIKPLFEDALLSAFEKRIESDGLNGLVLQAGLTARAIVILRLCVKYLVQTKFPFSPQYMMQALTDNPKIAALCVELFTNRFDPNAHDKNQAEDLVTNINQELTNVTSSDQDRVLRSLLGVLKAGLRTNYYQLDDNEKPKDWVSLKIDSSIAPELPDPKPLYEIFVYSPKMEGIHLRGSKVSRGGIRWSDRFEDFRTEILGLMQAQMVKNAVIVPEGAKGGFIVKNPSPDRTIFMQQGIACYQTLIRGMLDVTDNLDGTTVIPPKNVVRIDGDDPYIVAAADKGTASFSDIANKLSAEYNFWLGDAFASGGSAGYDHKHIGITARGAWESVKRHFREMGTDCQTMPFTVIGVGDMGGDVFGNGMLQSHFIKLVAAFNHQHIFIDPTPDCETSFVERDRLFKAVKGWGDYDLSKLSKGGRIYNRQEKSLDLTPEIQAAFGISVTQITPNALITILLKAKVDLLFFGGIGTYIKASTQSHADAGDKGNDSLRVDANEIRASVIGEGANLALTRQSRVELGQLGVRLNADFIDNSGGVDCSDHEVNIKILLAGVMRRDPKALSLPERNSLLASMTDEVADLVLRTSYQSAQAISTVAYTAAADLQKHSNLIATLENTVGLKRKVEGLPSQDDIENRLRQHQGLTRSEIAILISHAKMVICKGILNSSLPDDPESLPWLVNYFPQPLREKYLTDITTHKLRREIIATQMAASIVNRLGPSFVFDMVDKTGASIADVAKICFVVREAFGLRSLWHDIEDLDGQMPAIAQLEAFQQIIKLMDYLMFWVLKRGGHTIQGSLSDIMLRFKAGVRKLNGALAKLLPQARLDRITKQTGEFIAMGMPDDLARRIAWLGPFRSAGDVIRLAHDAQQDVLSVARVFYHLGEEVHFDWLRNQARKLKGSSHWQAQAIDGVVTQLYTTQATLVLAILSGTDKDADALDRLHAWENLNAAQLTRLGDLLKDMQRLPQMDLAMLTLAEQRLRQLAG